MFNEINRQAVTRIVIARPGGGASCLNIHP
jgi:hypothetical protein